MVSFTFFNHSQTNKRNRAYFVMNGHASPLSAFHNMHVGLHAAGVGAHTLRVGMIPNANRYSFPSSRAPSPVDGHPSHTAAAVAAPRRQPSVTAFPSDEVSAMLWCHEPSLSFVTHPIDGQLKQVATEAQNSKHRDVKRVSFDDPVVQPATPPPSPPKTPSLTVALPVAPPEPPRVRRMRSSLSYAHLHHSGTAKRLDFGEAFSTGDASPTPTIKKTKSRVPSIRGRGRPRKVIFDSPPTKTATCNTDAFHIPFDQRSIGAFDDLSITEYPPVDADLARILSDEDALIERPPTPVVDHFDFGAFLA